MRKLRELKDEISILLERIEKVEIVKVQMLVDAEKFAEENDLDSNLMYIEEF